MVNNNTRSCCPKIFQSDHSFQCRIVTYDHTIWFPICIRFLKRSKYFIFQYQFLRSAFQSLCQIRHYFILRIIHMNIMSKAHHRSGRISVWIHMPQNYNCIKIMGLHHFFKCRIKIKHRYLPPFQYANLSLMKQL